MNRNEGHHKSNSKNDDPRESSMKTMRPPCRQSDNVFDLDDLLPKANKKVIRIVRKQARPPSRHKTPPKAVGLELPPDSYILENMLYSSTPANQLIFNTQPLAFDNFSDKNAGGVRKPRADSVKSKTVPKNTALNSGSRGSSAKNKSNNIPPIVNKRKIESSQGNSVILDMRQTPNESSKRSTSRVKQQNFPIFTDLQTEFLDLFA